MLDFDLFTRIIDEAGPTLGRIDFFNYGEAFLHKRAVEMCEYIKTKFPHIYLYTSTNGLAFTEEKVRQLARSGIDEVTFSLDGSSQEAYVRYRQRGNFDKAIANLRALIDEKRKTGRDVPFVNWRYILFNWNDSDEEMARARQMAADIGVDRLCWEITDHPEERVIRAASRRARPTTSRSSTRSGTTAVSAMRSPARRRAPRSTCARCCRICRSSPRPRPPLTLTAHVKNVSTRPFRAQASYGRRLVRLGAQLIAADGTLLNRDHARAWLPDDLAPGAARQRADRGPGARRSRDATR